MCSDDASLIAAYARGWTCAQKLKEPHLNPYTVRSDEWFQWHKGFEEGQPHLQTTYKSHKEA